MLDGSQVADLGSLVERSRGGLGDLHAFGVGRSEPAPDVEVIDSRQCVIDGRWLSFEHRVQVRAVVAYRPVAPVGAAKWIAVELGAGQPGEVLAGLGGVRAAGLLGERSSRQVARVRRQYRRVGLGQAGRSPPAPGTVRVL